MILKLLRLLENLFFNIGSYFGDLADSIDTDFHDELLKSMNDDPRKKLD